ncbi:hypothetical protein M885DRAFT_496297 [Pelagophyceae sp. CCMP2097]|nr:hypothetical protein M885DRAFT_496297 [Pelagophyceae sp. CCMP2097]
MVPPTTPAPTGASPAPTMPAAAAAVPANDSPMTATIGTLISSLRAEAFHELVRRLSLSEEKHGPCAGKSVLATLRVAPSGTTSASNCRCTEEVHAANVALASLEERRNTPALGTTAAGLNQLREHRTKLQDKRRATAHNSVAAGQVEQMHSERKMATAALKSDLESQIVALEAEATTAAARIAALEAEATTAAARIAALEAEATTAAAEATTAAARIVALEAEVTAAAARIAVLEAEVRDFKKRLAAKEHDFDTLHASEVKRTRQLVCALGCAFPVLGVLCSALCGAAHFRCGVALTY